MEFTDEQIDALEEALCRSSYDRLSMVLDGKPQAEVIERRRTDMRNALADLLAARDRRVRAEAVEKIARQSERLRRENPMVGDGANHMLDRVQRIMAAESPGATLAVEAERKVIWAEREADYARLEAENKRRREADA